MIWNLLESGSYFTEPSDHISPFSKRQTIRWGNGLKLHQGGEVVVLDWILGNIRWSTYSQINFTIIIVSINVSNILQVKKKLFFNTLFLSDPKWHFYIFSPNFTAKVVPVSLEFNFSLIFFLSFHPMTTPPKKKSITLSVCLKACYHINQGISWQEQHVVRNKFTDSHPSRFFQYFSLRKVRFSFKVSPFSIIHHH